MRWERAAFGGMHGEKFFAAQDKAAPAEGASLFFMQRYNVLTNTH